MYVGVQWRDRPEDRSIVRGKVFIMSKRISRGARKKADCAWPEAREHWAQRMVELVVGLRQVGLCHYVETKWEPGRREAWAEKDQPWRCVTSVIRDWGDLEASTGFEISTGAGPPLQRQRKWPLLGMGSPFHKSLRNAGYYLTTRSPSVVQPALIPGHSDFLRPNSNKEWKQKGVGGTLVAEKGTREINESERWLSPKSLPDVPLETGPFDEWKRTNDKLLALDLLVLLSLPYSLRDFWVGLEGSLFSDAFWCSFLKSSV